MSSSGTRINLDWGYIQYDKNEVQIVSTIDDPPGIRLGKLKSAGPGRSLGKLSFNVVRDDGTQEEVVLLQGKRRYDDPDNLTGELYVGINRGGQGDADMVDVALIHHDGIECRVPITAPGLNGGSGVIASTSRFYSDHGKYVFNVQDDQVEPVIIVYATHGSTDESTWTPIGQMKMVP